ncbi:VOC family protein [Pantoea sp. At-9b]|uniref:VOC family protein n=1 Tax=Pantoea sp. (strain At-9b) TaxID=592316 RepID=UPI0001B3F1E5|nr:VOC family protein [Pantoea sp. At-9b]ADU71767.1 conserved hypothetical protein [Pantoea sp. At-9b]
MTSSLTPRFDHAVINVDDQLDRACERFTRMGFQLLARGHHTLGSSNHLAIFGENYLELLGYEPTRAAGSRGLWQVTIGLAGLVWKTADAHAAWRVLKALQLDGEPPTLFSREVTLPDGEHCDARFCITRLRASAVEGGFSFFCQHLTPQAVWQPAWQQHPNGVQNITEFVLAAENPGAGIALYAKLFASEPVLDDSGAGYRLQGGRTRIRVITPAQVKQEFGLTINAAETRMVALVFSVASLSVLQACLDHGDIPFEVRGDDILVSAEASGYLPLVFRQAEQ